MSNVITSEDLKFRTKGSRGREKKIVENKPSFSLPTLSNKTKRIDGACISVTRYRKKSGAKTVGIMFKDCETIIGDCWYVEYIVCGDRIYFHFVDTDEEHKTEKQYKIFPVTGIQTTRNKAHYKGPMKIQTSIDRNLDKFCTDKYNVYQDEGSDVFYIKLHKGEPLIKRKEHNKQ